MTELYSPTNCQATGTGPGLGLGTGDGDGEGELGMGNGRMGNREYPKSQELTVAWIVSW